MRKSYVAVEVPGAPRARKQKKTRALLSERAQVPSDQSRSVRGQDWGEDTRSTISDYARGLMSTFTSVEKYCTGPSSAGPSLEPQTGPPLRGAPITFGACVIGAFVF